MLGLGSKLPIDIEAVAEIEACGARILEIFREVDFRNTKTLLP